METGAVRGGMTVPSTSGDVQTASAIVHALCAATPDGDSDDAYALAPTDVVSLTDLASFFMRGPALSDGDLVFQQHIVPYLIDSPFCPTLQSSRHFSWFGYVPCRIFVGHAVGVCGRCFMIRLSFLSCHRNVVRGFVPILDKPDGTAVNLSKLKPDGGVAYQCVPLLFVELKPRFVQKSASADQCVFICTRLQPPLSPPSPLSPTFPHLMCMPRLMCTPRTLVVLC